MGKTNDGIAELTNSVETIFGKKLLPQEKADLKKIIKETDLPEEAILIAAERAAKKNLQRIICIEAIVRDWDRKGFTTITEIQEYLDLLNRQDRAWDMLVALLQIKNHTPSIPDKEFADKWWNEYKHEPQLIVKAHEETMKRFGKFQTHYMDEILMAWYNKGITG